MKIALVTQFKMSNYGAALQAFATEKMLSQYGEVVTIDYFKPNAPYKLDLIRFESSVRGIKMMAHDLLRLKDRRKVVRKFKEFRESNMNLSRLVTRHDIQNGAVSDFDVYVCGSDQIWNPNNFRGDKGLDPIYFASFANKEAKKVSYASSINGHRFIDREKEELKALLEDFATISVRESGDREMLSQLLGREVFHVLDPTLLLSKKEWFEALGIDNNYRSQKGDYILVYRIARDPLLKKVVEFFAKKVEKKVVIIDQAIRPLVNADVHVRDAGPVEFVELFANASYVVANSFHAICFSINFGKPFVPVRSGFWGTRIDSVLDLFDIGDRQIKSEEDICNLNIDFDYEFLREKLEHERAVSIGILSSSIMS